jgi:hypothetical protein
MTTAIDLIESAALKLGAKATGETLTASEVSDSLKILNSMLENWSIKKLMIYQIVQNSYTWAAGAVSRTIGQAGDINTTRPIKIEDGTLFNDGTSDFVVRILSDRVLYDALADKTSDSSIPSYLYYEPAHPLGILYAYPVPGSTLTLKLNTWTPLQHFANQTTNLAMPPGYQWAIEHNLAVALEPVFSVPVPMNVMREAKSSMMDLMRINHIPVSSYTETAYILNNRPTANILIDG